MVALTAPNWGGVCRTPPLTPITLQCNRLFVCVAIVTNGKILVQKRQVPNLSYSALHLPTTEPNAADGESLSLAAKRIAYEEFAVETETSLMHPVTFTDRYINGCLEVFTLYEVKKWRCKGGERSLDCIYLNPTAFPPHRFTSPHAVLINQLGQRWKLE